MTGSIGLPEFFMDESKWQLILLVYFGGMIFGLPVVVWRWCGCVLCLLSVYVLCTIACYYGVSSRHALCNVCVCRWSNTEQFHGAFKVMNKTMQHYYTKVNEATRVKSMPSILACAAEVPT